MKFRIAALLIAGLTSVGVIGCNESKTSSAKQETKITTPGGSTTITTEKDVKTTGDKPPSATP